MIKLSSRLFACLPLYLLTACSLFEYHPYEVRLKDSERDLNAKSIEAIRSIPEQDTVTLLLLGDTQRFYDETESFVKSANKQQADFVVLAGDISDFGLDKEFQWVNEIMSGLNKPYIGVIGNHDISGEGETIFQKMYGPLNDRFVFNGIKFILINTNSLEYGNKGQIPNIRWLKSELSDPEVNQAIVIGHVPPFNGDFDASLEEDFVTTIRESGKVKLALFAHEHRYSNFIPYDDSIRYIITTAIFERSYVKIKIWSGNYSIEQIHF